MINIFPHENVIQRKVESRGFLLTVGEHRSLSLFIMYIIRILVLQMSSVLTKAAAAMRAYTDRVNQRKRFNSDSYSVY